MPGQHPVVQQKLAPVGRSENVTLTGAAQAARITAVLTNADFTTEGFGSDDWLYTKNLQDVSAKVLGRAPYPLSFLTSDDRQKRNMVRKRGLLVSAWPDSDGGVPVTLSIQVTINSRYLRKSRSVVVGRAGPFTLAPGGSPRKWRVKLSRTARRALGRRRATNVIVRGTFREPTGTATQRNSETIRVVR